MNKKLVIGVDFGSDSARAILADTADGKILATEVFNYPRWAKGEYCDPSESRFRQHPLDYVEALEFTVKSVVSKKPSDADIVAISVDTTGSTPCLTDANHLPLALLPEFSEDPDAMFVLWKDHTGMKEGKEITEACTKSPVQYASHSGGVYSAENFWSKVLHILRTNNAVAGKAVSVIEQCDFIPMMLTGKVSVSHCAAACKQLWSAEWGGYPPKNFFSSLDGRLDTIVDNLDSHSRYCTEICGYLSGMWASKLCLSTEVKVGVGNIDAHSGAIGAGCSKDVIAFNLGTSACVMAVCDPIGKVVPGVFAQGEGIIIEGMEGFEMGLSSFGDNFAWVKRMTSKDLDELAGEASSLPLDDNIPLSTDWFNGRRTPRPAPDETATVCGLKMTTTPAQLFYSIVESSAFGLKAIVDHLTKNGVDSDRYVAIGGISRKSPFVMQMIADVLGHEIEVSSTGEACALGAAIHASVVAGIYPDVPTAQKAMCASFERVYSPSGISHATRYEKYLSL